MCNFSQIVDHDNVFQLPEAMKVVDALIRSAQELLFDASSDVDVKVMKCFNIREHYFIFFAESRKFCFQAFRPALEGLSNCSRLAFQK